VVSYLSSQKGFDILIEGMDEIMDMDLGLVILGKGDERYENQFLAIQDRYPGKFSIKLEMNPPLAHKIAAGADIFLIPSLYEPCGLNQLYSFCYGTVPVVRSTGGLGETVKAFDSRTMRGNGFIFKEYSWQSLIKALKDALRCYAKSDVWQALVQAGLKENFSWEGAARRYARLYRSALEMRKGG
jgi:starch synthase